MRPRQKPSRRPARRKQDQFRKGVGAVERMTGAEPQQGRAVGCLGGGGGLGAGRKADRQKPPMQPGDKERESSC